MKQFGGGAFTALLMFTWPLVLLLFVAALGAFGYALWHAFTAIPLKPMHLLGSAGLVTLFAVLAWKTERDQTSRCDQPLLPSATPDSPTLSPERR